MLFAKTPGKWFTHSRVVAKNGHKAYWFMILLRSMLRLSSVDLFFGPFLGGPLHDFASSTTVVQDPVH
jgi:uncharacterized RDD family membrane protein YckC